VGDIIGVTGTLGDSAAGLYVLSASTHELRARFAGLVEAHLRPRPKLRAGQVLASLGVNAMEDVSDGLAADLSNICTESATGCEVRAEDIPLDREIIALAAEMCYDPLDWALGGGEDYELIFTAPPGLFDEAVAALGAHGTGASRIGTMTLASSGMRLITGHGNSTDLKGHGYDHFL
jgi:thiamine-monophosphate kinase